MAKFSNLYTTYLTVAPGEDAKVEARTHEFFFIVSKVRGGQGG